MSKGDQSNLEIFFFLLVGGYFKRKEFAPCREANTEFLNCINRIEFCIPFNSIVVILR